MVFVGRQKDVIKHAGYSVYAREVEQALERHPSVLEAAVVGLPEATKGEVPAAAVRLIDGADLGELGLEAWTAQQPGRLQGAAALRRRRRPAPGPATNKLAKGGLLSPVLTCGQVDPTPAGVTDRGPPLLAPAERATGGSVSADRSPGGPGQRLGRVGVEVPGVQVQADQGPPGDVGVIGAGSAGGRLGRLGRGVGGGAPRWRPVVGGGFGRVGGQPAATTASGCPER